MTAVSIKKPQITAECSKVIPRQVVENFTSSATFMKQLTVIAVSTITFLNNAFPEDCYTNDVFGRMKIKILKKECSDELAQFLITALTNAFEAFDKKYLEKIVLCFYEEDCKLENLLEYYILEFTYISEGFTLSVSSKSQQERPIKYTFKDIHEQTIQLLKNCVVMVNANSKELPDTYDVVLRLYYNEEAPEGYQAPGFNSARDKDDPLAATFDQTLRLGHVQTPYHGLVIRSYFKDQLDASREAIPSQNPPEMTQAVDLEDDPMGSRVVCACGCDDCDDALLTCIHCATQQHAACYGVRRAHAARVNAHCCAPCADADDTRVPTDTQLATTNKKAGYAIFRRALEWCTRNTGVSALALAERFQLSAIHVRKLMKSLHSLAVIRQEPDSDIITSLKINENQLNAVMKKYFRTDEEDIVTRLVEETFAQQTADPVKDVLSASEIANLQHASNIGRVIEPEVNNNDIEDETLKQYREALVLVDKLEDLPFMNSQESLKEFESKGTKRKAKESKVGIKSKKAKKIKK